MELLSTILNNMDSTLQYTLHREVCAECESLYHDKGGMIGFHGLNHHRNDVYAKDVVFQPIKVELRKDLPPSYDFACVVDHGMQHAD